MLKSLLFYIPIAVDIIAILIALYFVITDSIHYTASDNNGLGIITFLMMGWVGLSWFLYTKEGTRALGTIFAWVPAVPLLGYALIVLLFIILKPDMR